MQLKHRGKSHWWLLDPDGRVIDLTLGPRETSKLPVPPRPAAALPLHAGRDLATGADDRGAGPGQAWLKSVRRSILGRRWSEAAWTDERLDDLADAIGNGFDRVDRRDSRASPGHDASFDHDDLPAQMGCPSASSASSPRSSRAAPDCNSFQSAHNRAQRGRSGLRPTAAPCGHSSSLPRGRCSNRGTTARRAKWSRKLQTQ